jgi:hypothetical protein
MLLDAPPLSMDFTFPGPARRDAKLVVEANGGPDGGDRDVKA